MNQKDIKEWMNAKPKRTAEEVEKFFLELDSTTKIAEFKRISKEGISSDIPFLIAGLKDRDVAVSQAAKVALSLLSEKGITVEEEEMKKIRWLAQTEVWRYKEMGLFMLGCFGSSKDVEIVLQSIAHKNPKISRLAEVVLKRMKARGVLKEPEAVSAAVNLAKQAELLKNNSLKKALALVLKEGGTDEGALLGEELLNKWGELYD